MPARDSVAADRLKPTRPRARLVAIACVGLAGLAAGGVMLWSGTPNAGDLGARLAARLRMSHTRAVPLRSIAPMLSDAVVATEDEHFYDHAGVDVVGLLRAIPYDLSHATTAQGGSTITEQLAKQLYLGGNDHTPLRKLQDIVLALKLEQRYSKEQILGAYLNSAYFGDGAYGIYAASRHYFGVAPAELDIARASMLAGLIQAPSSLDPMHHPHAARIRQIEVLRSLVRNGFISARVGRAALTEPLRLASGRALPAVTARTPLSPGPAFDWRELGLGLGLVALATVVLAMGVRRGARSVVMRLATLAIALLGIWALIRSFRVA